MKVNKKVIIISFISVFVFILIGFGIYFNVHGLSSKLSFKLLGKNNVTIDVNSGFKDSGYKAFYGNKDIARNVSVSGKVNTKKVGKYTIVYKIKYKMVTKVLKRNVSVIDKISPEIKLVGGSVSIVVGSNYSEPGVSAIDNYDGDLTNNIVVSNNIDNNKVGEYEVVYKVKDSSNNKASATRKVIVIEKRVEPQKIAVLNYHFFYDPKDDSCSDGNCENINDFKAQLNYLKENNYKTLTMKEFRDWMYGVIEIPDKSVLITIDDGAKGTGIHNGNKLIPILEEYKVHATLFLITGWWDINNYKSSYLDIESHTHDMHKERICEGVTRGAQMLCNSDQDVLNDLKASINVTNSKLAFCFPFYAYNDNAIKLVKEAGFELAFIGGGYKVSRNTDKYHIPRYQIKQSTSLETFINYVN